MLDIEKELSIMKRRIMALEETIDKLETNAKQKDMEIEGLKRRIQSIEFKDMPLR